MKRILGGMILALAVGLTAPAHAKEIRDMDAFEDGMRKCIESRNSGCLGNHLVDHLPPNFDQRQLAEMAH